MSVPLKVQARLIKIVDLIFQGLFNLVKVLNYSTGEVKKTSVQYFHAKLLFFINNQIW